jgi:hypothetical protein
MQISGTWLFQIVLALALPLIPNGIHGQGPLNPQAVTVYQDPG